MARYRGRHRAPSTTGRTIAHTVVVGAVAGAPLFSVAPAAYAAPGSTWERLAECESGGRWNINTGNGYQGGLQFSPRTWTNFGGDEFAPRAHQATRAEQIVVAERVLAEQGWGAWPSCSRKVKARGEAEPTRRAPERRSAADPTPTPSPTPAPRPTAEAEPGPATTPPPGPAVGPVPLLAAALPPGSLAGPEPLLAPGLPPGPPAGAEPLLAPGLPSGPSAGPRPVPAPAPVPSGSTAPGGSYTVRDGDTLSSIAARHGVPGGWRELAHRNPDLAADPDRIRPGQLVVV